MVILPATPAEAGRNHAGLAGVEYMAGSDPALASIDLRMTVQATGAGLLAENRGAQQARTACIPETPK
jgi:hypothetical protein